MSDAVVPSLSGSVPLPACTQPLRMVDERTWVAAPSGPAEGRLELAFPYGPLFLRDGDGELFVLPGDRTTPELSGSGLCWVLPERADADEPAWLVQADGPIAARLDGETWRIRVGADSLRLRRHRARPHADVDGAEYAFDIPGGDRLAEALAGFTWGTVLPSVIECTTAARYPDAAGFVVSTLADRYLGTYPDVDHEFQIKGRLASGSRVELDVVGRMIDLQLRMMREDPAQLWRNPCAVQPNGDREYHVRRNSMDGTENAVMFLVTGNVEVIESIWLYVARTGDLDWLGERIADIEGAASGIEEYIDPLGRLWGDVYYEDQVIKDGRETMAQALAIRSFELLAQLEDLLGRGDRVERYRSVRDRLSASLREPLPHGWWDPVGRRFVDWVDRSGRVHDHLHLLANILPVLVGAADADQVQGVEDLVARELPEFQRFPTFLAARIADYTDSEIGDGGPYDLCAAGRYWCWDAAYWASRRDGRMLRGQLDRVAAQGAADGYVMGERYDMDHVYYVDGSPWHGAAHYYEYPCVFTWVLLHLYLGVGCALDVDVTLAPQLTEHGSVTLPQHAYRLRYRWDAAGFQLENLAGQERSFRLDLRGLFDGVPVVVGSAGRVAGSAGRVAGPEGRLLGPEDVIRLAAGASITLVPLAGEAS